MVGSGGTSAALAASSGIREDDRHAGVVGLAEEPGLGRSEASQEEVAPSDRLEEELPGRGNEAEPLPDGLEVVVTIEADGPGEDHRHEVLAEKSGCRPRTQALASEIKRQVHSSGS